MADTPNHGYNVPDQGSQDWHSPLNENFEAFEVDIELREVEANLGEYTPTEGTKFLATDTGVVYVGDGADWVAQFVHPGYDAPADEANFAQTVTAPAVATDSLSGQLTGGQALTDIAGTNLSINNGQLDASTGGGGGGISSLSGGDGIDPASIGDGDTLSVAWGDANSLDSDGNVTGGGGGEWQQSGNLLEPSGSGVDGVDVNELHAPLLDAGGGPLSVTVDGSRALELTAESSGDGGNVVAGHSSNSVDSGVSGGTVAGGGYDDGNTSYPNVVTRPYGTVSGGRDNTASGPAATVAGGENNDANGDVAAVGGGAENTAGSTETTVSGGFDNTASDRGATIAGGSSNVAGGFKSSIGGGSGNEVAAGYATVGGGRRNEAVGEYATIAGGGLTDSSNHDTNNVVYDDYGAIGGGGNNQAGSDDDQTNARAATVGGGESNEASAKRATVSGGFSNEATGSHATVPGGESNEASGSYSFAAGRNATASHDGSFVVGDSSSNVVESTFEDTARFQGGLRSQLLKTESYVVYYSDEQSTSGSWRTNYHEGDDEWRVERRETFAYNPKMWVTADGNVKARGSKDFVDTVDTDDGEKEVHYTAGESGTPHTDVSGVAELDDGRVEIDLPEHFTWVTSEDDPLHVQTTPYSADSGGLAVVERSTEQIVVEDLDREGGYEFSYTVRGTREGYEDKQVVREPSTAADGIEGASPADD